MTIKIILGLLVVFLAMVNAFPALSDSNTVPIGRNRVAVMHSYQLGGQRNVRWETVPITYVGPDGKPMTPPAGKNGAECTDIQGKSRSNGEEYERPNHKFKYHCKDGNEEVVACIASDRANKARIEVGQTLNVNGFWHKCESFPNSSVVYTQENTCKYGEKEYKVGDEIHAGFLRMKCLDNGYEVVGCVYIDENKNRVTLNPGETKQAGQVTHVCEEKDGNIQYFAKGSGCTHKGKDYKEGDKIDQNHLHYVCTNGLMAITGCYIKEGQEFKVGQDKVEEHMVYRCYKSGGKVEYTEYACGFNQTPSCTPEPIPQSEADNVESDQDFKSRGFGAIAVARKVGGTELKLDLDKTLMARQGFQG